MAGQLRSESSVIRGSLGLEAPGTPIVHELKVWPEFWEDLENGLKPFELRFDDRGFSRGHLLHLREWNQLTGYTGREMQREVTYYLAGSPWLAPGYCCLGIRPPALLESY